MLVSVIIPIFNRSTTILRAIESVVVQKGVEWELWVIDDGSTDDTGQVIKNYLQSVQLPNIYYHRIENSGVSVARNIGVDFSKGEYIAFLDSDDQWMEDKLRLQVQYLEDHPQFPLVHSEEVWIRNGVRVNQMNKHKKSGGDIFSRSLRLCLISPSAVMLRREALEQRGNFDPEMTVCEDYDLWLRITSQSEVGFISKPLIYKYGGHDDQLSRRYIAMDYWRVKSIHKLLNNFSLSEKQRDDAVAVLIKKCEVLLRGYRKHNNLQNYDEVDQLYQHYSGKKFHT